MLAVLLTACITVNSQEVSVVWLNETAKVTVSDDIQPLLTVKVSGADVTIDQNESVAQEITYHLSGKSDNGSFTHTGSFKITLSLEGLQLTSQTGSAMQVKNGKRIAVVLKDGTENMLTDLEGGDQKACLIVKGHSEFQGGGTLTVNARGRHGIKVKEYVEMKSGTLNITTTGGGYWDAEDLETKAAACIKTDENVIVGGGTLNLLSTGDGGKGINCDENVDMYGGTLTVTTTGSNNIGKPKGVKSSTGIIVRGGSFTVKVSKSWACDNGTDSDDPAQRVTIVGSPTTTTLSKRSVIIKY